MRQFRNACIVFALMIFLWLGMTGASAETLFQIEISGPVSGYHENTVLVTAPESGTAVLEVRDENNTLYRRIEASLAQGANRIHWDGLGWNEERMALKQYQMSGVLTGESGASWKAACDFTVTLAHQAVLFALPSAEEIFLEDAGDWFMEFRILFTDTVTAEFRDAETGGIVHKASWQAKGGRVNRIPLSIMTGRKNLPAGTYQVRFYGAQNPAYGKEFSLSVKEGAAEQYPLRITGDIMPAEGDSDETIWAKMMAPATVVDIKNTSHQKVYAEPDSKSMVLGTLHGQSQTLSVLEIQDQFVRIAAWNHEKGEAVEGWVPRKVLKVVRPQSQYGLLVDKKNQTMTIFHQGERIDTLLVSTGRMQKGELYQETAAGSFLTDEHMSDYSTNGLKYDFVIRYDGGNLLHQIPYAWNEKGKKDMIPGEILLGTKASHACIRIQQTPSEKGINAYWLWTHLPYHTRVIVLDDPEQREKLERLVTDNTPDLMPGLAESWQVDHEESEEDALTITFGGDVVLAGRESYFTLAEGLPAYADREGMNWFFSGLQSVFNQDDFTVVNLECVLKDDAQDEDLTKQWRFRGLTSYVDALTAGGIEMVNVANNHTIDYGEAGYRSTLEALKDQVLICGNGNNTVINIKGFSVGFGGCRETTYKMDPGIIQRDIQTMKEQGAEVIIYQCHWGVEYEENHNVLQEAMARACQRAGADLVIGHHPHVVQGIDYIEEMPVVYSLGNLMFGGTIRLSVWDGMLVQATVRPRETENRISLKLIPVLTSGSAAQKINNYQPVIARDEDALRILRKIQKDTPVTLTEWARVAY